MVDEHREGREVEGEVGVGQPLAEAEAEAVGHPQHQLALRTAHMARSGASVVLEDLIGEELPGQVLGGRRGDLMVLGPQRHRILARLKQGKAEVEHRLARPGMERGGQVAAQHALEQQKDAVVCQVEPGVHEVDQPAYIAGLQSARAKDGPWLCTALAGLLNRHLRYPRGLIACCLDASILDRQRRSPRWGYS